MRVQTSYYGNLRRVKADGFEPVRISVGAPRWIRERLIAEPRLAPTRTMLNLPYDKYERLFRSILAESDPQQVWDELHERTGGVEPVLLCFEKPPFHANNWCHRRMVAKWFEDALGVEVLEAAYGPGSGGRWPAPKLPLTLF